MTKRILVMGLAAIAALTLMASPASAQYPTETFTATIDDVTLTVGESFTIQGTVLDSSGGDDGTAAGVPSGGGGGLPATALPKRPGDTSVVDVAFAGSPIGTMSVQSDGAFSGTFTTPDVAPGDYTVSLDYNGDQASITVTVLGAQAGGGTGGTGGTGGGSGDTSLARTGTEVDGLIKIGGGLLVAGAAAVLFTTKRRSSAA